MANLTPADNFASMYAALEELGLTENERRLYVAALANGPDTIASLAKQLGIPRPNLYKVINGLAEKGLVDPATRLKYAKHFIVEPPSKISELLRAKRETQSSIDHAFIEQLPSYIAQFRQGEGPMKIKVLVGQKEFMKVYEQVYQVSSGEVWFIGSITDFAKATVREFIIKNAQWRVERNMPGKALFMPEDRTYFTSKENADHMRDVRYLNGFAPFSTAIHLFNKHVIIWQPKAPMAVLVEDEYVVAMMRSIFMWIWEKTPAEKPA